MKNSSGPSASLRASEREIDFRAIFEAAPDRYLLLSTDFRILAASDAYLRATMVRREDVVGRHVFEVFPDNPDDSTASGVKNLRSSLETVLDTRKPDVMPVQRYDVRKLSNDFEMRVWCPSNFPVLSRDGKLEAIIHRVDDVTSSVLVEAQGSTSTIVPSILANSSFEREETGAQAHLDFAIREVEVARSHSDRNFYAMAEAVPVIMWTANADGWIDWYNGRWFEYTGQTLDEATGWGWQTVHHPIDFPEVMRRWAHSISTGTPFEMEFRLRAKDGSYRWFLTRVLPQHNEDGQVMRWYGSNVDITDHKATLRQTRRMCETLQRAFLPSALPQGPYVRFDALYVPAEADALIGGDWYDASRLPGGRYLISIGDFAGHGLNASIIAGRLRQAIIDFALICDQPALILQNANRSLRFLEADTFATAIVGIIDADCTRLTFSSAGHLPPLLWRAGLNGVISLPLGSVPLGIRDQFDAINHNVYLQAGDVITLYTDGLVEFSRDVMRAQRTLEEAIARVARGGDCLNPAQQLRNDVVGVASPTDDLAILVIQVVSAKEPQL